MKIMRISMVLLALPVLLLACSTKPSIDYSTTFDFSSLRSFSILPVDPAVFANPKVSELEVGRILNITSSELRKAYLEVAQENADFLVRHQVVVENRVRTSQPTSSVGMYRGGYGYGYSVGMSSSSGQTTYYQQGTVIIDVIDAATKEVVWRGTIDGRIRETLSPQEREVNAEQYIARLFEEFPPQ